MAKLKFISLILFFSLTICGFSKSAQDFYNEALANRKTKPAIADSLVKLSLREAEIEKDFLLLSKSYQLAAKIQLEGGRYNKAETYFLKALAIASKHQLKEIEAKCTYQLGYNYLDKGQFDLAVENALKSAELAEEIGNDTIRAKALGALAEMYRQYDFHELALQYNQQVIEIAQTLNDEHLLAKGYNNLSATLGEMDKNEEAIDSLQKALLLISTDNNFARAKFNSNIGYCYRNLGEFDQAIHFHRIALTLKKEAKMTKSIPYSLGAIGRAFLGKGNIDSAIYYIEQEYTLSHQNKVPHLIADAASHLAEAYEKSGNFARALSLSKERKAIEDSIYQTELEINALKLQKQFDLSQQQKELDQLKHQQKLEETKNQVYLVILIALLVISILLSLLFRTRIRQKDEEKRRVEVELESSKLIIQKDKNALQEYTKDLMAKNKSIRDLTSQLEATNSRLNTLQDSKTSELEQLNEFKILTENDWTRFKLLFEKVYPDFFSRINSPSLKFTRGEKRLMALIKLDMQNSEIADALGISTESVSKSKFRLKKKLDSNNVSNDIEAFLYQL